MKLKSCYVSSFGKLKDFRYDFGDKLNTIKEDNGWGKSTFAYFIKAMFYGISASDPKHGVEDNERKRFAPWNSTEQFGGYVVFEREGKEYKIERFFGTKRGEESVKLIDLATNRAYTEGDTVKDLGKRIFGIDEEGFLSTTFLSQKDFEVKNNSSITAKYNEVCEVEGQESFEKALLAVENEMKKIKVFRGDKGLISDLKREIAQVSDKIVSVNQAVNSIKSLEEEENILQSQAETLNAKQKEITEKLEIAAKTESDKLRKETFDRLNAEKVGFEKRKAAAEKVLNGRTVTEEDLKNCENKISELNRLSGKEESLRTLTADSGKPSVTEKPQLKKDIILALAAAAVAIAGVVLAFTVGIWFLALAVIGVIALVAEIALFIGKRKKTGQEKLASRAVAEMYERNRAELSAVLTEKENAERDIKDFFAAFCFGESYLESDYSEKLRELRSVKEEYGRLTESIKETDIKIKGLGIINDVKISDGEISIERLKGDLSEVNAWLKSKITAIEKIKSRIETLKDQAETLLDLETKKSDLQESLSKAEKEYKILSLVAEHLKNADETLKIKYRAPLQESLNKYLVKTGANVKAFIDTDMKVTVEALGAEREAEYFSKGYRNLFGICKRFALTDVLFTREKPFIILDDPFYDLDDEKLKSSLALIKELSEEYQILYLVCHDSRRAG